VLHEERLDLVLRDGVEAGFFADVNHLALGAAPFHQLRVDEVVVNEDVGLRDELLRAESDEAKVAGTGANEMNDTRGGHGRKVES